MNNMLTGIYIFIVGMTVLFAALGGLALVIKLLDRIFQGTPETPVDIRVSSELEPVESVSRNGKTHELAIAAAVAVTYLLAQRDQQSDLGKVLESPPGRWWQSRYLRRAGVEEELGKDIMP